MTVIARESPSWVATITHELRGPLTALATASELLDRDLDLLDAAQVRVMVSGIHRRALWMRGLMENLLCSAAINEGRFTVHTRPTDLADIAREVEVVVGPLLERKRQNLRIVASTSALADADAHRISQVFLNLISNAHKYSAEATDIEIDITRVRGIVRVSVSDRGPGLPHEVARSAFKAYDRAGRSGGDGLGIGLWVVRSIVRAHGGRVGVVNRAGGGATFWFELQAARAQTELVAAAKFMTTTTSEMVGAQ
jgi:signal transduction histidine kinase